MAYDFGRGRQMIVHDPRLNNPLTTPPTPLKPPAAYNVWTVQLTDPVSHVVGWPAHVAAGTPLDALHFMAHGYPGGIQIGAGYMNQAAVPYFRQFKDAAGHPRVRYIVMFSCEVGGDNRGAFYHHPAYFGQQLAAASGARVVMAQENQIYSWNTQNVIDFGDFEGEIDVYEPGGAWSDYQAYNPFRTVPGLRLDQLIFGH